MGQFRMTGRGNLRQVTEALEEAMTNAAVSCELTGKVGQQLPGGGAAMLVFSQYYMRVSSRASLSVLLCQNGEEMTADIIASGGGQGVFSTFDWGAEENFEGRAAQILESLGFR